MVGIATGIVTETVAMPWAAVRVASAAGVPGLARLRPYARRLTEDERSEAGRIVATVRVGAVEECGGELDGGEPIVLHQELPGSIRREGDGYVVVNHSRGTHYHVETGDPPSVTCCVGAGQDDADLLEIVRGLLVGAGLRRLAPLRGAAIGTGEGVGVLIAGGPRAGKTCFSLGLLTRAGAEGAALVGDDRLLFDAETRRAYGLPFAISIDAQALPALPALAALPQRREGDRRLFWPAELASALGIRLLPSVVLGEQWWCGLDFSRLGTALRPAPPPSEEPSALSRFSARLLPVWLLELLGEWSPRSPVGAVDLPAARVEGNPWRAWLTRPPG